MQTKSPEIVRIFQFFFSNLYSRLQRAIKINLLMYLRPFVVGCKCGDVALDLKYIISQTIKEKKIAIHCKIDKKECYFKPNSDCSILLNLLFYLCVRMVVQF